MPESGSHSLMRGACPICAPEFAGARRHNGRMRKERHRKAIEEHRLAELVRALARQAAERDYDAQRRQQEQKQDHETLTSPSAPETRS